MAKSDSVLFDILTSGHVHKFWLFCRAPSERPKTLWLDTKNDQYSHQSRIQTLKKIDVKGWKKERCLQRHDLDKDIREPQIDVKIKKIIWGFMRFCNKTVSSEENNVLKYWNTPVKSEYVDGPVTFRRCEKIFSLTLLYKRTPVRVKRKYW